MGSATSCEMQLGQSSLASLTKYPLARPLFLPKVNVAFSPTKLNFDIMSSKERKSKLPQNPSVQFEAQLIEYRVRSMAPYVALSKRPIPTVVIQRRHEILLVNHGVNNCLVEKIKEGVEELYKLPIEEKRKKLWRNPGEKEGFGDSGVLSDEQILDWNDEFFLFTLPVALRNPHLFPNLPLPLSESLKIYSVELAKLAMMLISQMEKILGIKSKEISKLFEDGIQGMCLHYYPPCPQPDQVSGLAPHSDAAAITILYQLNQVDGFQVNKDGMWIPVNPLPNAFLVNLGDQLEVITPFFRV
uniref:Fe2OG dioxygenase domain-containing protein n=1 Tax=Cannabis sativa TaxID=3483 RepID=A0A803NPI7_CANSA